MVSEEQKSREVNQRNYEESSDKIVKCVFNSLSLVEKSMTVVNIYVGNFLFKTLHIFPVAYIQEIRGLMKKEKAGIILARDFDSFTFTFTNNTNTCVQENKIKELDINMVGGKTHTLFGNRQ